MKRYCLFLPEHRIEHLQALSLQTGISAAEVVRRTLDFALQETVLNQLVPTMSGQLVLQIK